MFFAAAFELRPPGVARSRPESAAGCVPPSLPLTRRRGGLSKLAPRDLLSAVFIWCGVVSGWSQVNVLPNGSFERAVIGGMLLGWTNPYLTGVATVISNVPTRCGDQVLQLLDDGNDPAGVLSDPIGVLPGESLTAEAYILRTSVPQNSASLHLKYYNVAGVEVGSVASLSQGPANAWDYVAVSGVAPAGAASVRVLCCSSESSSGIMYFDGVSLRRTPLVPPANQLIRYVAPASAGTGSGLTAANPVKYNNGTLWSAVNSSLTTNPVTVIFLEGEYTMDTSADRLVLANLGNASHRLTLEGERPFGSVFTRTDAAVDSDSTSSWTMVQVQRGTNIVIRHLHWENDTTVPGKLVNYCLAVTSGSSGNRTRDIAMEGCSFVGLSWNIYGAFGFHHRFTHGGRVSHCEFITGGYSGGFHMIYNAYGAYDLLFENNYFQDCAGSYLRLRAGCHDATVRSNQFVSTTAFYNQPFVQWPTFNNIEPGDETWGYNFIVADNRFTYHVAGGAQTVALHLYHGGFDPLRSTGLLWDYLLTPAEAGTLSSGTAAEKRTLIRRNFGLNFDTQIILSNNVRSGFHAAVMKLESRSNQSYNYQDGNGVWHICPNYGGDGSYDISDILTGLAPATTGAWLLNASGNWDNPTNWTASAIPNAHGAMAILTNNMTGTRTVTMDTDVVLGALRIGSLNGASSFTVAASGGSRLTFGNHGNSAQIIATTGSASDSISAPIVLLDPLTITNMKMLSISGVIGELGGTSGWGGVRTLTKSGGGTLDLTGANTFTGGVTLQSGPLRVGNNSALGTGTLTIQGGTLASSSSVARSLANPIVVAGNFILGQAGTATGPVTLSGPMNLVAATRMITVSNAGPNVISGAISGGASLTKAGPGALTLSGANTYTGPTVVSNTGTLLVNGSLKSSSLTVRTGATFGGNGSVAGAVLVSSGGKLAPGNNGPGTLTISNTLTLSVGSICVMELNRTTGAYDAIRGLSVINYGGTLIVTNLGGSFQGGEAYALFPPAAWNGKFAETNLPPLGGGLRWIWNPDTGVLSVGHPIAATPTNIVFNISGNSLSLAWPESHLGWLVQSNAVDVAEAAGWGDIAGSQFLTNLNISINPTTTNVFFRLRRP